MVQYYYYTLFCPYASTVFDFIRHLRSSGLYARLCDGWIFIRNAHKGLNYGLFPANGKVVLTVIVTTLVRINLRIQWMIPCPVGTYDISPVIYRWDEDIQTPPVSPVRTTESKKMRYTALSHCNSY